jgi:CRISPR-associated protein Csd2
MTNIQNKIDFAVIFTVDAANPNGDPLNGNRPRTTIDSIGEVSDVCIKRKIRNRLQDMGKEIFVQSNDRADDGFKSLRDRANQIKHVKGNDEEFVKAACNKWFDVRAFGQLFAFPNSEKNKKKENEGGSDEGKSDSVSIGIRGPVSIRPAFSVSPVNITSVQITKSVNSETGDKKGSDTMGMKHRVDYGVYVLFGSINTQLARRTGFSDSDAEDLKKALITLFENDSSSARPDGSMEIVHVYWWKHNCSSGQHSSAKVHGSLIVTAKTDDPRGIVDYDIKITDLNGLVPEIY